MTCFEIEGFEKRRRAAALQGVEMRFNSPLNNVRVAAPCPADWDQMLGNDRSRFCGQCNLNVYNLSAMSRSEAEDFIARSEGRVCIRYYKRTDGSIITENCPVGLRALRKRLSYVARAIASAVIALMTGVGLSYLVGRLRPVTVIGGMIVQPPMGKMVVEPLIVDVNLKPRPQIPVVTGRLVIVDKKTKGRRLK